MAIAKRSVGAVTLDAGGGFTVAYPTSTAGDLLVLFVFTRTVSVTLGGTDLSSWTEEGRHAPGAAYGSMIIYTKTSGGTTAGVTPDMSITSDGTSSETNVAAILAFSGVDTSTPMDVTPVFESEASAATFTHAGIDPVTSGAGIVMFAGKVQGVSGGTADWASWTYPTSQSMEELFDGSTNAGANAAGGAGWFAWNSTAATGQLSVAVSNQATGITGVIALRPASSGSNYSDDATASGAGSVSASDVAAFVDSAAASPAATVTASDTFTPGATNYADEASALGEGTVTASAVASFADVGPASAAGTVAATDVGSFAATASAAAEGTSSAAGVASFIDTGTSAGAGTVTASSVAAFNDSAGAAGEAAVAAQVTFTGASQYADTAAAAGEGSVTAAVIYSAATTASAAAEATVTASASLACTGNATALAASAITSADVLGCVDIATAFGEATAEALAASVLIDVATASPEGVAEAADAVDTPQAQHYADTAMAAAAATVLALDVFTLRPDLFTRRIVYADAFSPKTLGSDSAFLRATLGHDFFVRTVGGVPEPPPSPPEPPRLYIVVGGTLAWTVSVDNYGTFVTAATDEMPGSFLVLVSPDGFRFVVTCDGRGTLTTTATSESATAGGLVLRSPDGTTWDVTVTNFGTLSSTALS